MQPVAADPFGMLRIKWYGQDEGAY